MANDLPPARCKIYGAKEQTSGTDTLLMWVWLSWNLSGRARTDTNIRKTEHIQTQTKPTSNKTIWKTFVFKGFFDCSRNSEKKKNIKMPS